MAQPELRQRLIAHAGRYAPPAARFVVAVLLAAAFRSPLTAQQSPQPLIAHIGEKVNLHSKTGTLVIGELVFAGRDSVVVAEGVGPGARIVTVLGPDVTKLEVGIKRGRGNGLRKGAGIGLLLGAGIGLLVNKNGRTACSAYCDIGPIPPEYGTAFTVLAGAVAGAVVGGVLGHAVSKTPGGWDWIPVRADTALQRVAGR
jgi:hypothetical protein